MAPRQSNEEAIFLPKNLPKVSHNSFKISSITFLFSQIIVSDPDSTPREHNAAHETLVLALTNLALLDSKDLERAKGSLQCATEVRNSVFEARISEPTPQRIQSFEEIQFIYAQIAEVMEKKFDVKVEENFKNVDLSQRPF